MQPGVTDCACACEIGPSVANALNVTPVIEVHSLIDIALPLVDQTLPQPGRAVRGSHIDLRSSSMAKVRNAIQAIVNNTVRALKRLNPVMWTTACAARA